MKLKPKHELPIVPTANLVDIAILLIIFYMACSNFIAKTTGKVVPPKARDLEQQKEPRVIVMVDDQGSVYLQGQPMPNAAAIEAGVTELLHGKATDEARTVMFKCDATVGREVFEPVLEAIVQGGGIILAAGDNQKVE
jgi:biopolymer transport protein ExbD